jgi:hypothetical protein
MTDTLDQMRSAMDALADARARHAELGPYLAMLAYWTEANAKQIVAALTPREPSDWQPIETAPPEYGLRLIGLLHDGRAVTIQRRDSSFSWQPSSKSERDDWVEEEGGALIPREPTHWMPLPSRPVGEDHS